MTKQLDYHDLMRRTPNMAVWKKRMEKHSEFIKPYRGVPGYQEMEHFYPMINWSFDFGEFDFPDMFYDDGNIPSLDEEQSHGYGEECWPTIRGHGVIWTCNKEYDYRPGYSRKFKENTWNIDGPGVIVRANVEKITIMASSTAVTKTGVRGEKIVLKVKYDNDADCTKEIINDCEGVCDCDVEPTVTFDDDSTPDTIAPGGQVTLYITGGCPPYSWAVTGDGYTLGSIVTEGKTNTLNSASGVCGTDFDAYVKVSIVDACGDTDEVYLRNTDGQWITCTSGGAACGNHTKYEYVALSVICQVKIGCSDNPACDIGSQTTGCPSPQDWCAGTFDGSQCAPDGSYNYAVQYWGC